MGEVRQPASKGMALPSSSDLRASDLWASDLRASDLRASDLRASDFRASDLWASDWRIWFAVSMLIGIGKLVAPCQKVPAGSLPGVCRESAGEPVVRLRIEELPWLTAVKR